MAPRGIVPKLRVAVPYPHVHQMFFYRHRPKVGTPFVKGNQLAKAENLGPDAHARRMRGLFKTWNNHVRKRKGEKIVTAKKRKQYETNRREKARRIYAAELREIQEIAKTHAPTAMKVLGELLTKPGTMDSVKIAAAAVIFDRAYGKASQTNINANIDANAKPSEASDKELDTRIDEAIKRVEALTGGKAKAPASKKRPPDLRKLHRNPGSTAIN